MKKENDNETILRTVGLLVLTAICGGAFYVGFKEAGNAMQTKVLESQVKKNNAYAEKLDKMNPTEFAKFKADADAKVNSEAAQSYKAKEAIYEQRLSAKDEVIDSLKKKNNILSKTLSDLLCLNRVRNEDDSSITILSAEFE